MVSENGGVDYAELTVEVCTTAKGPTRYRLTAELGDDGGMSGTITTVLRAYTPEAAKAAADNAYYGDPDSFLGSLSERTPLNWRVEVIESGYIDSPLQ